MLKIGKIWFNKNSFDMRPLHIAAKRGYFDIVTVLIEKKALMNVANT